MVWWRVLNGNHAAPLSLQCGSGDLGVLKIHTGIFRLGKCTTLKGLKHAPP